MIDLASYFGLFAAALGAATILPMQSESVLVGLLLTGKFSVPALLAVASIGNTLGSIVNWFLGRGVERFRDRRWFPVGEAALERSSRWYRKYGKWTLLLSWMPVLGDALTVVAGVLREPLLPFTILVFVAKTGRYVVLTLATLQFLG
ncbi:membrane protein YqaA with SNARE-associated domain [Rhizobium binae]|uniref:Membrane protein YqaA with SNARE-associated domain n=1 Tax=Rhizobium binae TaxID=1138190 RepID=A0ABV2MPQ2_9HYPH|nr:YqaA family protein [Rhizobium binae]MBX4926562.1 DedA family protein [Rhizobium binae]MBX4995405.1 DedA family protein [Rhizobium binae]NKL51024.1 DedA family protein [Rhizobium leguminosarum bv. viciae]QSY85572.1 DedA family protein [Rhizobium binae]